MDPLLALIIAGASLVWGLGMWVLNDRERSAIVGKALAWGFMVIFIGLVGAVILIAWYTVALELFHMLF